MRHCRASVLAVCLSTLQFSTPTFADTQAPAPPLVDIARQGYAFEFPRILARQRLYGIHHGVQLLAAACMKADVNRPSVESAFSDWTARQQAFIAATQSELLTFYYGPQAGHALPEHLVGALNLRESLGLDAAQLDAACGTFPEALGKPRYDLTANFTLDAALSQLTAGLRVRLQESACGKLQMSGEVAAEATTALANWHAANDAAYQDARAQVDGLWGQQQLPGTLAEWEAEQAKRQAKASAPQCSAFMQWLQTPAAQLAKSFALPEAPTQAVLLDAANPQAPVAATQPVRMADPASVTSALEAQQAPSPVSDALARVVDDYTRPSAGPNLLELLMKVFQNDTNAEIPDGNDGRIDAPRARSPRAYP